MDNNSLFEQFDKYQEQIGRPKKDGERIINIILVVLFVAVFLLAGYNTLFEKVYVQKTSMSPTIEDGDYVVILKVGKPQRGDIVVFKDENVYDKTLIKRVIAVGGDTLEIDEKGILRISYINDEGELTSVAKIEDYIADGNIILPKTTVPEGMLFVLGDNRLVSYDSSEFGCVYAKSVNGKVVKIFHQ